MSTVAKNEIGILIAVRMKSSRLSSKAMADIVGKPVIVHLIERMKFAFGISSPAHIDA